MGTRADFYIRKGKELKVKDWIGSIAWDGYPKGIPKEVKKAKTSAEFRKAVREFAKSRNDFTRPKEGWPWPWDDSKLTDYSYVFDCEKSKVKWNAFDKKMGWPDMTKIKNVCLFGKQSGLIVITGGR